MLGYTTVLFILVHTCIFPTVNFYEIKVGWDGGSTGVSPPHRQPSRVEWSTPCVTNKVCERMCPQLVWGLHGSSTWNPWNFAWLPGPHPRLPGHHLKLTGPHLRPTGLLPAVTFQKLNSLHTHHFSIIKVLFHHRNLFHHSTSCAKKLNVDKYTWWLAELELYI